MMEHIGAGITRAAQAAAGVLLAPFLALALAGCSEAPGKGGAQSPPPDPLIYEIASADGGFEGWLFGTIHALPAGTRWRTPAIDHAIETADLLVVEIAALDSNGPATFRALAESSGLPPLAARLPADLRPAVGEMIERGGMGSIDFTGLETWAAAVTLARVDAKGDPANGVDRALIADFSGRTVRELEGMRGQLSIFDRLPESAQRTMLAAVVRENERTRSDPERLQRAWLAGDAAAIEQAGREGFLADPALREALLTGRNRRWAAQIGTMLKDTPRPLIAVGTAHLVGEDGLVALLEAEGYRLRRLPQSALPKPVAKPAFSL